jgi:hypothetical protein
VAAPVVAPVAVTPPAQATVTPEKKPSRIDEMRESIKKALGVTTLAEIESLSAFLVHVRWLEEGELFDSLPDTYVEQLHCKITPFTTKYKAWLESKKAAK